MTRLTIVWVIIGLLLGAVIGFGLRDPIAGALNLNAATIASSSSGLCGGFNHPGNPYWPCGTNGCPNYKIWTGNGCADTRGWTWGDQNYWAACMDNIRPQPPNEAAAAHCAQLAAQGSPRKALFPTPISPG